MNSFLLKSILVFFLLLGAAHLADQRAAALSAFQELQTLDSAMKEIENKAIVMMEERARANAEVQGLAATYRSAAAPEQRREAFSRFAQRIETQVVAALDGADQRNTRTIDEFYGALNRRAALEERYDKARSTYNDIPEFGKTLAGLPARVGG